MSSEQRGETVAQVEGPDLEAFDGTRLARFEPQVGDVEGGKNRAVNVVAQAKVMGGGDSLSHESGGIEKEGPVEKCQQPQEREYGQADTPAPPPRNGEARRRVGVRRSHCGPLRRWENPH
jgi:hypothetical protein